MATATRKEQTVTTVTVTLTISEAQAKTLCAVTQFISGSPVHSVRKHTDEMGAALKTAGINVCNPRDLLSGSIEARDYSAIEPQTLEANDDV